MSLQEQVGLLADMLLDSRRTAVLTGAGISTESGIPDFRSPGGLWSKVDPMYAFSAETFLRRPEVFYREGLPHVASITSARPNVAHYVLAKLQKAGLVSCIITQNVDGLHQMAGSERVLEIHGHLRSATCMRCRGKVAWQELMEMVSAGHIPPRCGCGGVYKPDAVFFGDPLTADFEEATREAASSELMLVVGSSLEVAPANYLPTLSRRVVIVNIGQTMLDRSAALVIRHKAGETFSLLWEELRSRGRVSGDAL